ncbi:MAG: O-antigen ligase family protein [Bacteroidia bacterium]|nr:O-antigen ligase family protein [Bacteroidia bacterium]
MFRNKLNILLITLFIVTGGLKTFGIAWYWLSLRTPFFNVTDSLVLIIYLLFISYFIKKKKIVIFKGFLLPYVLIIGLLFVEIIRGILFQGIGIGLIAQRLIPIYTIVLFFPMIKLINDESDIKYFMNTLYWIAFIASSVYLYQFITGADFEASGGAADYEGIRRINNPGIFIVAPMTILGLSEIISKPATNKMLYKYFVVILSLVVCILTLSRGFIFGLFISYSLILYIHLKQTRRLSMLFNYALLLSIIGFSVLTIFTAIGFNSSVFSNRMLSGYNDISKNEGTFATRYQMFSDKMGVLLSEVPVFGVGLNYNDYNSEEVISVVYNDPYALNGDSTWQNVILVFGLIGVYLFFLIYIKIYKTGIKIYKSAKSISAKSYALGFAIMPVFFFFHGFSSSYFSVQGLMLLNIVIALLYLLNEIELKETEM